MPSVKPAAPAVVLLVQPHDDGREMYEEFLGHHGLTVVCPDDVAEALTLAPTSQDVIVTELRLPGALDGYEFIQRLRGDAQTRHKPVIVVTSWAWPVEFGRGSGLRSVPDQALPARCAAARSAQGADCNPPAADARRNIKANANDSAEQARQNAARRKAATGQLRVAARSNNFRMSTRFSVFTIVADELNADSQAVDSRRRIGAFRQQRQAPNDRSGG